VKVPFIGPSTGVSSKKIALKLTISVLKGGSPLNIMKKEKHEYHIEIA
jgi:hypothetical protein